MGTPSTRTFIFSKLHILFSSEEELYALVNAFDNKTLPAEQWDHRAHLVVALVYLKEYTPDAALCNLRADIIGYNTSVGGVNDHKNGYHETLTQFWLDMVLMYLQQQTDTDDILTLANRLFTTPFSDKNLPLQFYTEERLFSVAARARYMPPDKQPQ